MVFIFVLLATIALNAQETSPLFTEILKDFPRKEKNLRNLYFMFYTVYTVET